MKFASLLPVLFVIAIPRPLVWGDIVSFSDTEFPTSNWSVVETSATSNNPLVVHSREVAGGNPGAWRQLDVASGDFNSVHSGLFHFQHGASYNPSIKGEIIQLDYSFDAIQTLTDVATNPIEFKFAIRQNDSIYVSTGQVGGVFRTTGDFFPSTWTFLAQDVEKWSRDGQA